jgi:hypothetical protein
MTEVFTRPISYEVTAWPGPVDAANRPHYVLTVEWRGDGNWCVRDMFGCYQASGEREYEPSPSNREDDFIARTRFPLDEALAVAERIAPTMTVGAGPNRPGMNAAEMWEWEQSR